MSWCVRSSFGHEKRMTFDRSRSPAAVLFDIDGTLVHSNYVHVCAWLGAFRRLAAPSRLGGSIRRSG